MDGTHVESMTVARYTELLTNLFISKQQPLILDTRPSSLYSQHRLCAAVNIPLLVLTSRCYLLPDKVTDFAVVEPCSSSYVVTLDASRHGIVDGNAVTVYLKGAASLQDFLSSRGWSSASCYLQDVPELWTAAMKLSVLERGVPADPDQLSRRCLFAPSPLLAACIADIEKELLQDRQHYAMQALDIGCGSGRDIAWLASRQIQLASAVQFTQRGAACSADCAVQDGQHSPSHLIRLHMQRQQQQHHDLSTEQHQTCHSQAVLPGTTTATWLVTGVDEWLGALERAADLMQAMNLDEHHVRLMHARVCPETGTVQQLQIPHKSRLSTACVAAPFPRQMLPASCQTSREWHVAVNFDLIICNRFLVRALLPRLCAWLAPGGFIVYCTFLDLPGVQRFGRPAGREHLLTPGELAGQFFGPAQGFTVVRDEMQPLPDGREVCWFVARKHLS